MRLLLTKLILAAVIASGLCMSLAQAGQPRYEVPTLQNMTDFLFTNGYINPDNQQELVDYVIIKDCKLYVDHYKDDFAWNKIRNRIRTDAKSLQNDVVTHFVLPNSIMVERYNFVTKAFDIAQESQLRNVNILQLFQDQVQFCPDSPMAVKLEYLPLRYDLKLDTPISLYRIPMAEQMGRRILSDLAEGVGAVGKNRIFYMLVYVTADSVLDMRANGIGTLLGRVEKIEFFLDQARTQKFKTLYYDDL